MTGVILKIIVDGIIAAIKIGEVAQEEEEVIRQQARRLYQGVFSEVERIRNDETEAERRENEIAGIATEA
jgi:hypothetical protein